MIPEPSASFTRARKVSYEVKSVKVPEVVAAQSRRRSHTVRSPSLQSSVSGTDEDVHRRPHKKQRDTARTLRCSLKQDAESTEIVRQPQKQEKESVTVQRRTPQNAAESEDRTDFVEKKKRKSPELSRSRQVTAFSEDEREFSEHEVPDAFAAKMVHKAKTEKHSRDGAQPRAGQAAAQTRRRSQKPQTEDQRPSSDEPPARVQKRRLAEPQHPKHSKDRSGVKKKSEVSDSDLEATGRAQTQVTEADLGTQVSCPARNEKSLTPMLYHELLDSMAQHTEQKNKNKKAEGKKK